MFSVVFFTLVGNILIVSDGYPELPDRTQIPKATGTIANIIQVPYISDVSQIENFPVIPDLIPFQLEFNNALRDLQLSPQVATSAVAPAPSAPGTPRNIFHQSDKSDVSQIADNELPWVNPDLIPIIQEFRKKALEGLQTIPKVKAIWDFEMDSDTSRAAFFKVVNDHLWNLNYPASSTLANIVSKSASSFNKLSIKVFMNAVVISLAEFLLSRNIEIEPSHVQEYLGYVTVAFESADLGSAGPIIAAFLAGYGNFVASLGFNLLEVINQAHELFASELIVLHDM